MKKFYLLFVLGIVVFLAGCGEQNSQSSTMSASEQLASGKDIVISLNAQTPTTTEVSATGTTQTFSQEMSMDATATAIENPTNEQIQQALKNAGLYEGAIDGSIGKKSKSAIIAFQEQNGLVADGKVGRKTWAKLAPFLSATSASPMSAEPSN
jgi:peptidoglycan hydrolase-like protein with peptidoglycan-binding domain